MLADLEKAEAKDAANSAKKAIKSFESAMTSFSRLSEMIRSDEYRWIGDATRAIDFDDAARTVYLSPNSPLVTESNFEIVNGNIYKLFVSFAQQIGHLSETLKGFANRAVGPNVILDDEYRLAHELLRDWGLMIATGQYVSSVCLAAATKKA